MASPLASSSRAVLAPCRLCQRRAAAAKAPAAKTAGKTVGKTAQKKNAAAAVDDPFRLSPVAASHVPAELHAGYPFVRHVVYTGAGLPPAKYTAKGHVELPGSKSFYRYIRDRARDELGHSPAARQEWVEWFSSTHPDRLYTGAILAVETYNSSARTSTSRFAGMLLGIKRAGGATTFTLRNVVHKTGVEITFILGSPMIKDISIVLRADASKYRTDEAGTAIYPRWPRQKAWDIEKRPGAWQERTSLALRLLQAQAQAQGRSVPKRQKGVDQTFL